MTTCRVTCNNLEHVFGDGFVAFQGFYMFSLTVLDLYMFGAMSHLYFFLGFAYFFGSESTCLR